MSIHTAGLYIQSTTKLDSVLMALGKKKGRRQDSGDGCLKKWMNFLDLVHTIHGILRLRARRMAGFETVIW